MNIVSAKVYLIGSTKLDYDSINSYLDDIGSVKRYNYDYDDADKLTEIAGRLCYKSWEPGLNKNVSKIREDNKGYINNLLESGHGSVLEHVNVSLLFANVSRVFTHELVRHRAGCAYCLSGDTEVWSGSKQQGMYDGIKRKWTMKEIYEKSLTSHGRSRLRLMLIRCFNGIEFVPAKIRNIYQSGIKELFEIRLEDGKNIKASKDHLFLTKNGWVKIENLNIGNELGINGRTSIPEKERKEISERMQGENNHQWQGNNASDEAGRYRAQKLFSIDDEICSKCGVDSNVSRIVRHHIDEDTLNNDLSNIDFMCNSCHTILYNKKNGFSNILTINWSKIVSIKSVGDEMTYDLSVLHDKHNFVANGFVTHNSQESLRYVRLENINFFIPEDIKASESLNKIYQEAIEYLENIQKKLNEQVNLDERNFEFKKIWTSRFRRLAPLGLCTHILATGNLRAWRHIINMRSGKGAEEEIRGVMEQVRKIMLFIAPHCFQDMNDQGEFKNKKV